jgi:hypothetical protein
MTGAILGAGLIGAVASSSAAGKASDSANRASASSAQASASQLAFNKQQYSDWQDVFGPTEKNLSSYYNTLDPNTVAASNVNAMQQAFQQSQVQVNQAMAQRGMQDSGLSTQLFAQGTYQNEMSKAQAVILAPQQVAQQRQSFLQIGLGQQGALQNNISNAYSNQITTANNQYTSSMNQLNSANQSMGSAVSATAMGLGYAFNHPAAPTTINLP